MEKITLKTYYSFTINKACQKPTLMEEVRQYLKILMKYVDPYANYNLYPELSCTGKLHYHGYIAFKDFKSIFYFYRSLSQMGCAIEIDTIADEDKWQEYITKQSHFKPMYKERLIPYKLSHTL